MISHVFVRSTHDRLRKLMEGSGTYVEKYNFLVSFAPLKPFFCEVKFCMHQ